jgi:hypothetical protein
VRIAETPNCLGERNVVMNCDECVHHSHPLPVFWLDLSKVAVSLPHVANGCFTASIAAPPIPGIGREATDLLLQTGHSVRIHYHV